MEIPGKSSAEVAPGTSVAKAAEIWPARGGRMMRGARRLKHVYTRTVSHPVPDPGIPRNQRESELRSFTTRQATAPELLSVFRGFERFPEARVLIHGSWADDSRTPFSDLDDLVIVDDSQMDLKRVLELERWLNSVDRRFLRLDPLQHHGHWIIRQSDLLALDESYMPMIALQNSLSLGGEQRVDYRTLQTLTKAGIQDNIRRTCDNIDRWVKQQEGRGLNAYQLKMLLSSMALLPAYLFQAQGRMVTKKWAIEHADEVLSGSSVRVLEQVTAIRRDHWRELLRGKRFAFLRIASFAITNPHIYRRFADHFSPPVDANSAVLLAPTEVLAVTAEIRSGYLASP